MANRMRVLILAVVALAMACSSDEPLPFDCTPGQHRSGSGCVDCASGTYSDHENAERCEPHTVCQSGAYVVAPGSDVSDLQCEACAEGTWDDDADPGTACVPWTACAPGEVVSAEGSATGNRTCAACVDGFSTVENATSCTPWRVCAANEYVSIPGTATVDHTCGPVLRQSVISVDSANEVRTGETFSYRFDYVCASDTGECQGAEVVDLLSREVVLVSTTPAAPSADVTVTPDYAGTGRTQVRFGLGDLVAGESGSVEIAVRFPNGSTPSGTTATNVGEATNLGTAPGTVDSESISVTAVAEPQIVLEPQLTSFPTSLDVPLTYWLRLMVGDASGSLRLHELGNVTADLAPGTVFNGAMPPADCQPGCVGTTPATVTWSNPCPMPLDPGAVCHVMANLTFPSATFPSGANVTNSFTASGTPLGLSPQVLDTAHISHPVTTFEPAPDGHVEMVLEGDPPAIHQALTYELTVGNRGNVPLDHLVVIATLPTAVNLTSVTAGQYYGLGAFAVGEGVRISYEKNTAPGVFSLWGASSAPSTDMTLVTPPPGLGAGEYVTRVRWEYGHASPGMFSLRPPTLSAVVMNPSNDGWPVSPGKEVSACAALSAVFTADFTSVNANDCEDFVVAPSP